MEPVTNRQRLHEALNLENKNQRQSETFNVLRNAAKHMVRPTATTLIPQYTQTDDTWEDLLRRRNCAAYQAVNMFIRIVAAAPKTLTAFSVGAPSPIHGNERDTFTRMLPKALASEGFHLEPDADPRQLTYAVADCLTAALATLAPPHAVDPRIQPPCEPPVPVTEADIQRLINSENEQQIIVDAA